MVSVSLVHDGADTHRQLKELRKKLPEDLEVVAGGTGRRGPRRGPSGVRIIRRMKDFRGWFKQCAGCLGEDVPA